MSVITIIDGIPLFSRIGEAQQWNEEYGLVGHHAHSFQGQIGYMGGTTHNEAIQAIASTAIPIPTVPQPAAAPQVPTTPNAPSIPTISDDEYIPPTTGGGGY